MKKIAVYPGSFNPYHQGHQDILDKALKVFDRVIVAKGVNPDKNTHYNIECSTLVKIINNDRVTVDFYNTLLVDYIKSLKISLTKTSSDGLCVIIRGLRNGSDLQYETNLQYWNEDLGLDIPVVYFVTDRKYCHISSSAIRQIALFTGDKYGKL